MTSVSDNKGSIGKAVELVSFIAGIVVFFATLRYTGGYIVPLYSEIGTYMGDIETNLFAWVMPKIVAVTAVAMILVIAMCLAGITMSIGSLAGPERNTAKKDMRGAVTTLIQTVSITPSIAMTVFFLKYAGYYIWPASEFLLNVLGGMHNIFAIVIVALATLVLHFVVAVAALAVFVMPYWAADKIGLTKAFNAISG